MLIAVLPLEASVSGLFGPEHELCGVQFCFWIGALERTDDYPLCFVEGLEQAFIVAGSPDWPEADELRCGCGRHAGFEPVSVSGRIDDDLAEPEGDHVASHGARERMAA